MVGGPTRYRNRMTIKLVKSPRQYWKLVAIFIISVLIAYNLFWTIWISFTDVSSFDLDNLALTVALVALVMAIYEIGENVRSGRLSATIEALDKIDSVEMRDARYLLYDSKDDDWTNNPDDKIKVKQLMAHMNQLGLLVYRNLVDRWMVLDLMHRPIIDCWNLLESYVNKNRENNQYSYYMKHFQFLCEESKKWMREHHLTE